MIRNLLAIPIIVAAVAVQTSIVAKLPLLSGYGDLPLVMLAAWALQSEVDSAWHWAVVTGVFVGFISGMSMWVFILGYMAVVLIANLLQVRVWQAPLLAMFTVTFFGSLCMSLLSFAALRLTGITVPFLDSFGLLILPSVLLNMLLAIPTYAVMRDIARWLYPSVEVE